MNSVFAYVLNAEGAKLTGEESGTYLTVLNPELLSAMGFKISSNNSLHDPKTLKCASDEKAYYLKSWTELESSVLDLTDIVFLKHAHFDMRTQAAKVNLRMESPYCSFSGPGGWVEKVDTTILIPEDISMAEFATWMGRLIFSYTAVPWLNTGGLEEAAALVQRDLMRWARSEVNFLESVSTTGVVHRATSCSCVMRYLTVGYTVTSAYRKEIETLMGVTDPEESI